MLPPPHHPAPSHTPWKTLRVSHSPPATTAGPLTSLSERRMHRSNCRRRTEVVDAGERVHRDTICRLLRKAGEKCEALMNRLVRRVPVEDVQADELWCFVGMKERTKKLKKNTDPEMGDAYTFVGLERGSKLALAFHMGRRTSEDASIFTAKLAAATEGRFTLSTDGFNAYPAAVEEHLGGRVDYGQIVKVFGPETTDSERRYSPPVIISAEKVVISGAPEEERICTSSGRTCTSGCRCAASLV
jgi:hypothetical protein